jgi:hypothetical protein
MKNQEPLGYEKCSRRNDDFPNILNVNGKQEM